MKKYLTRNEACEALYNMENKIYLDTEDMVHLRMMRICLVAEQKGLDLWGKPIEETRPIFVPSIPEQKKVYESELQKAIKIAKGGVTNG